MRSIYASIIGSMIILPALASAAPSTIVDADILSGESVTARYIDGRLDARIDELGTEKKTGQKQPLWKLRQNEGVYRHCKFHRESIALSIQGCLAAFIRNGGR